MTALAPREQAAPTAAPPARNAGYLAFPLLVALLAAAGGYLVYRIFLRTVTGQLIDNAALAGEVHHPKVEAVLGRTLNGTTLVSVVLVCVVAAVIGVLRGRADLAAGAAFLVLGSNASAQLLKTRLVRPDLDHLHASNSFPSGHTAAAASVAFALMLVLPQAVRGLVALIGFGYVTVIAVATVWADWHRPSDTIAAMLIVLAWGSVAVLGIRLFRLNRPEPVVRPTHLALLPLFTAGGLAAVAGVLGLLMLATSVHGTAGTVPGRFAFLAGSAVMAAAAAGAFVFWVRLASGPRAKAHAEPATLEGGPR